MAANNNNSKLVWSNLSTTLAGYGAASDGQLALSAQGYLKTHGVLYYLPLVDGVTANLSYADFDTDKSTFFAGGNWYKLPATAFNDTLYDIVANLSANDSQITNSISLSKATAETTGQQNASLNASFGNLTSKVLTGALNNAVDNSITADMNIGQALFKLEDQIKTIVTTNSAGMNYKGTTATTPQSGNEGDYYKLTATIANVDGANTGNIGDAIVYHDKKWYIIPSGDDQSFATVKVGTATLNATTSGSPITIATDGILEVSLDNSTKKVTLSHTTINTVSANATQNVKMTYGGETDFISGIVSDVSQDYGHTTKYNAGKITVAAVSATPLNPTLAFGQTTEIGTFAWGSADAEKVTFSATLPSNPNTVTKLNLGTATNSTTKIYTTEGSSSTETSSVAISANGALSLTTSGDTLTITGKDSSKVVSSNFTYSTTKITWNVKSTYTELDGEKNETQTTDFLLTETFKADASGLHFQWQEID